MQTYTIYVNDIEKAHGVTGKDALALIEMYARQGDGTETITMRLERN